MAEKKPHVAAGLHVIADDLALGVTEDGDPMPGWLDFADVDIAYESELYLEPYASFADFLRARGDEYPI